MKVVNVALKDSCLPWLDRKGTYNKGHGAQKQERDLAQEVWLCRRGERLGKTKKEDEREETEGKLIILAWQWKAFELGFIANELSCCAYGVGVSLPERF